MATMFTGGLAAGAWMRFVEPWWFKTTRRRIPIGIAGGNEITALHLSDFHADPMPLDYLRLAIRSGLAWKPDVIFCTGDFITSRYDEWDAYAELLGEMPKVAPTFACLGNHDGGAWSRKGKGYPDTTLLRVAFAKAKIQLLHNQSVRIELRGSPLNLVGLGDWWADEMRPATAFREVRREPGVPTVLLSHNPDTKDELREQQWDLMVSGHTHGGQLSLPVVGEPFAPIRDKRYVRDLHLLNDRWLYITTGVGCLHTARFNSRPEISLLTLA